MSLALYGPGMHDFLMRELEIGWRAAICEDEEVNAGWSALLDLMYEEYLRGVEQGDHGVLDPSSTELIE